MPISADQLRHAMRRWASGVTIVSASHEGALHGMTVSSFTSLSLDPPLVLVSLERSTRTHAMVAGSGSFGISILTSEQQAISDRFARARTERGGRFEGLKTFELETGAPLINGSMVCLDCRLADTLRAGTHTLFVGEVVAIAEGDEAPPLLYYAQAYREISDL